MDHDQHFKTLIREFFADFLLLFFADWAARFDLERVEWLDKEVQADPPDGSLHVLDLVAKVPARMAPADTTVVLVHIEIESADRTTRIEPRLPAYYFRLREAYHLPILPIVIYLEVGLDGIGVRTVEDTVLGFRVATVNYLYVGLPGLDAVQYVEGDNYLGVALSALMRIPRERIAWLGAEALRRLIESPLSETRRLLLLNCVDTYLPLDRETRAEFERLLLGGTDGGAQVVKNIIRREAIEEGVAQGRLLGQFELLEAQLTSKYGPLAPTVVERLRSLSPDRLRDVALKFASAASLAELGLAD